MHELVENIVIDEKIFDQLRSNNKKYSPEQRVAACAFYCIGESSRKIEKLLGIPAATVRYWMQQPWWTDLLRQVKKAYQEELDGKLTRIIHKSVQQLEDRVENGNIIRDPQTGELVRVPLRANELSKDGLGIPFDKRALTRGDPTSKIVKETISPEKMLEQLAEQFISIVEKHQPKAIDGEVVTDDD